MRNRNLASRLHSLKCVARVSGATLLLLLFVALPAQAKSFLWQVEKGGNTCYLAGSVHFADEGFYPLAPAFEQAFASSQALVVEADVTSNLEGTLKAMARYATNEPGVTLEQLLSDKTKAALDKDKIPWKQFLLFRPWYMVMSLQGQKAIQMGMRPDLGVDVHFIGLAKERGLPVKELESVEQQFQLLSDMERLDVDTYVRLSVLELHQMERSITKLREIWLSGDARGLNQLLFGRLVMNVIFKPWHERLYYQRNERMAEKILGYLETGQTHFIIAGAGHVVGERGLVRLLADQGCTLTQL
ncbi:MAG: TraB/GumN family protein [Desulfovibrionaceae bacterium]